MVWTGPLAEVPAPLEVRPELTDEDVAWLNDQMALVDDPPVRYARTPPPPPPFVVYSA